MFKLGPDSELEEDSVGVAPSCIWYPCGSMVRHSFMVILSKLGRRSLKQPAYPPHAFLENTTALKKKYPTRMRQGCSSLSAGSLLECRHVNCAVFNFPPTPISLVEFVCCATSTDSRIQCIYSFARYRIFLCYYTTVDLPKLKIERLRQRNAYSQRYLETGRPFISHIKRPAFRT
jgi:hypothetical protein